VTSWLPSLHFPCMLLQETESKSRAGPVRISVIVYIGISRNHGKPLSPWSMVHPICNLGSHRGSVAVDLGQISLSPSTIWSLKMLPLIIANRVKLTHHSDTSHNISPSRKQKSQSGLHQLLLLISPPADSVFHMIQSLKVSQSSDRRFRAHFSSSSGPEAQIQQSLSW
jgi:hypothetical protein